MVRISLTWKPSVGPTSVSGLDRSAHPLALYVSEFMVHFAFAAVEYHGLNSVFLLILWKGSRCGVTLTMILSSSSKLGEKI